MKQETRKRGIKSTVFMSWRGYDDKGKQMRNELKGGYPATTK